MTKQMTKKCLVCGKEFEPPKKNSVCCCKECSVEYVKNRYKYNSECKEYVKRSNEKYRIQNKDRIKKYKKEYRIQNKEKISKYYKQYYTKNKENIAERKKQRSTLDKNNTKEYYKQYRTQNKNKINEYLRVYRRKKYKKNINYRLTILTRKNLQRCFNLINTPKDVHTFELLGYTPQELKQHLEKQFYNGMTWDNYGTYWEIHHIKPLHTFNFGTIDNVNYEQIKIANSLDNLQALTIQDHKLIHQC